MTYMATGSPPPSQKLPPFQRGGWLSPHPHKATFNVSEYLDFTLCFEALFLERHVLPVFLIVTTMLGDDSWETKSSDSSCLCSEVTVPTPVHTDRHFMDIITVCPQYTVWCRDNKYVHLQMKLWVTEIKWHVKIIQTVKQGMKFKVRHPDSMAWSFLRAVIFTQDQVVMLHVANTWIVTPGKGLCAWSLGIKVKDAAKCVIIY